MMILMTSWLLRQVWTQLHATSHAEGLFSCLKLSKPQLTLPMVRNRTGDASIVGVVHTEFRDYVLGSDTKHVVEFGQEYDAKFEQEHDTKVEADKSAEWKIGRCTGRGTLQIAPRKDEKRKTEKTTGLGPIITGKACQKLRKEWSLVKTSS
ncbi:hypothetical protein B0H14DRAFT_2610231 [Mycena olivaceomarginata]|nr:hypothetical protein B0H14DRAFT_2610231 [Mycena olivaceomarginata]